MIKYYFYGNDSQKIMMVKQDGENIKTFQLSQELFPKETKEYEEWTSLGNNATALEENI